MCARWKKLFVRTQASEDREPTIEAGSSLKGATTEVRRITTAGDLFLAVALRYRHETLEPIARSLREIRTIHHSDPERTARLQWMMERLADKPARWSEPSDAIAHAADLGITRVELEERDVPPEVLGEVRRLLKSDLSSSGWVGLGGVVAGAAGLIVAWGCGGSPRVVGRGGRCRGVPGSGGVLRGGAARQGAGRVWRRPMPWRRRRVQGWSAL